MLKTARCTRCGAIHTTNEMVKTTSAKRGEGVAYMCIRCATYNEGYHTSNNNKQGTSKANGVNGGLEIETSKSDEYARNTLFEYGFIPTRDGSLIGDNPCEYVSGIMQGLNIASKLATTLDRLIEGGHLEINESCGSHFHVSINAMKNENGVNYGRDSYMDAIRRFYNSLFTPLSNAMLENEQATKELFGRTLTTRWAQPINEHTDAYNRYNFINVTNDTNIEFRLNKFVNGKQFQNLLKMEVEMTKAIVNNFCKHFNEQPKDTRRYPTQKAYRLHKAQVTAEKLVKIYREYANL